MKALSVVGVEEIELREVEKPKVKKNMVLIKVSYTGICGSDLPRYFNGGVHSFPQILGHEFSGIVEEVGSDVTKVSIKDRVAVVPLIPCGKCENCKKGLPAMCNDYSFVGSRESGAMAEYVAVPENNCILVPSSLSMKEAALLEPLTVALHGIDRVSFRSGVDVMVLGTGTIGLLTILSLRARGVGTIVAVDINEEKLQLAKICGADIALNPAKNDVSEYVKKHQQEIVFETAGSSATQVQSINYVNKHGKVVYIGTSTNDVHFTSSGFEKILRGEITITGAWMSYSTPFPGYEWEAGIRYMDKKQIDVTPLITGIYKLEDKEAPFNEMRKAGSNQVKILYKIAD